MSFFEGTFAGLAPLEWVDPGAFRPDEDYPRAVCGLMLTLALVHCDVKNLGLMHLALLAAKPAGQFKIRSEWGEYNGLVNHVNRLHIALIHELFDLIQRSERALEHPSFGRILAHMKKDARASWLDLVAAAKDSPRVANKDLMLIRNKVAFHYDPKELLAGFEHFYAKRDITDRAYLSRGTNWQQSRFYFADAAAESSMHLRAEPEPVDELYGRVRVLSNQLNHAIWNMVNTFMQQRGCAFHDERVTG